MCTCVNVGVGGWLMSNVFLSCCQPYFGEWCFLLAQLGWLAREHQGSQASASPALGSQVRAVVPSFSLLRGPLRFSCLTGRQLTDWAFFLGSGEFYSSEFFLLRHSMLMAWDMYCACVCYMCMNVCIYGCISIWKPKDASTFLVNWGLLLLGGHAAPGTCLYLSPLPGYLEHMPQHMSFI